MDMFLSVMWNVRITQTLFLWNILISFYLQVFLWHIILFIYLNLIFFLYHRSLLFSLIIHFLNSPFLSYPTRFQFSSLSIFLLPYLSIPNNQFPLIKLQTRSQIQRSVKIEWNTSETRTIHHHKYLYTSCHHHRCEDYWWQSVETDGTFGSCKGLDQLGFYGWGWCLMSWCCVSFFYIIYYFF